MDSVSGFDRFFGGLYARRRRRYIAVLLALNTAWVLLVAVPVHVAGAVLCAGLGLDEFGEFTLVTEGLVILATPGLIYLLWRRLAPAARLLNDDPGVNPAAAWAAVVIGLPRTVMVGCLWVYPWVLPLFVYMGSRLDRSAGVVLGWATGTILWMAGAGLFDYLLFERALMPVAREARAALPDEFEPPLGAPSLRGKMLTTLLLLSLFGSTFVAGVTINSTNGLSLEMQFVAVFVSAGLFMACFALPLSRLLRDSIFTRLEALRVAMTSVDRGELAVQVVPLGGDELDELGRSFNEMVGRVRRHDEELRESRARIVTASDAARRRVERDLHDGAQQHLVALRMRLGMARRAAEGDTSVSILLDETIADVDRALQELRDLAHGIFPAALVSDGLVVALEAVVERCPLPVTVECIGDVTRLAPEVEAAAYFCCVEAMQNASKHAGRSARLVTRLEFGGEGLRFEVRDDGVGYDAASVAAHGGLQNMTDRISAAGGTLQIESSPGIGTRVVGEVPQLARR